MGNCYHLFTISLSHPQKEAGDLLHISAINIDTDAEYAVDISPNDIYGSFAEYFTNFCSTLLNKGHSQFQGADKSVSRRECEISGASMISPTKFMQSLLWLKLLVSHAVRGQEGIFASEIRRIGFSDLSISGKFVRYIPSILTSREEPAALVIGIGKENTSKLEYGIQIPKIICGESNVLGQRDYLKQYEHICEERENDGRISENSSLFEQSERKKSEFVDYKEVEHVKMLERECEELKKALRELMGKKSEEAE